MLLNYIILHTMQQTKPCVPTLRFSIVKQRGSHSASGLQMSIHNLISTVFQDSSCSSHMPLVTGNLPTQLECFKPTLDAFSVLMIHCISRCLMQFRVAVGREVPQFWSIFPAHIHYMMIEVLVWSSLSPSVTIWCAIMRMSQASFRIHS